MPLLASLPCPPRAMTRPSRSRRYTHTFIHTCTLGTDGVHHRACSGALALRGEQARVCVCERLALGLATLGSQQLATTSPRAICTSNKIRAALTNAHVLRLRGCWPPAHNKAHTRTRTHTHTHTHTHAHTGLHCTRQARAPSQRISKKWGGANEDALFEFLSGCSAS